MKDEHAKEHTLTQDTSDILFKNLQEAVGELKSAQAKKKQESQVREELKASKRFAIGKSDFKAVIAQGGQIVDKSLLIKEVLDDKAAVKLIIRPRRFGKTFNLSMLRYFFDSAVTVKEEAVSIFKPLKIWSTEEGVYQAHQGKYPVIFLTLKDIKANNFDEAMEEFAEVIGQLYRELLNKYHFERTQEVDDLIKTKAGKVKLQFSLKNLTEILFKVCGSKNKTILLLDEYDTPLHAAYENTPPSQQDKERNKKKYDKGYYGKMSAFMQALLVPVLKDNDYLEGAVLTGILRVSKDSIFSGLNNLRIYSVLDEGFSRYFGFSQDEVRNQLQIAFGTEANERLLGEAEEWYGGYQMGKNRLNRLFNPWSVSNFVESNREHKKGEKFVFQDHWINTSENSLIKKLLLKLNESSRKIFLQLLQNQVVTETINEHTVFCDVGKDSITFWSFLLLSGYLTTYLSSEMEPLKPPLYRLIIPNKELYEFYGAYMKGWFKEDALQDGKPLLPGFKAIYKASEMEDSEIISYKKRLEKSILLKEKLVLAHILMIKGYVNDFLIETFMKNAIGQEQWGSAQAIRLLKEISILDWIRKNSQVWQAIIAELDIALKNSDKNIQAAGVQVLNLLGLGLKSLDRTVRLQTVDLLSNSKQGTDTLAIELQRLLGDNTLGWQNTPRDILQKWAKNNNAAAQVALNPYFGTKKQEPAIISSAITLSESLPPPNAAFQLIETVDQQVPSLPIEAKKEDDKKKEKSSKQFLAAAAFKFAVSFPELEKLTEHLADKAAILTILVKIQKGMQEIEGFFPIQDKNLYYPEIRVRLEAIDRWLEQIPATAGFHHTIRTKLQTAISPLQKDIHAFFLQEEDLSSAQLDITAFKFAVSFPELEKLTEHLADKAAILTILVKIQKGMQEIESFFPIQDKNLSYFEIRARLETIDRWLEQIPATAGFHYSIRTKLQTAISPLQDDIRAFILQEEDLSPAQLATKTKALYAQQAFILRNEPIKKALSDTLHAIQQGLSEERVGQRCFISYAWPLQTADRQEKEGWLQPFLRELYIHLTQAGIKPRLDIVDNQAGGSIFAFTNHIQTSEFALLMCTESLLDKHYRSGFRVTKRELTLLQQKYDADIRATGQVRVFPLLVSGSRATAILPEYNLYNTVRDWRFNGYIKNLEQLIAWIYYPPFQTPPEAYQAIWRDFYKKYNQLAGPMPDHYVQKELEHQWHRREMDKLQREEFYSGLLSQQKQFALLVAEPKDKKDTKSDSSRASRTSTTISYDMPRPVEGFIGRVGLLKTLATQFGVPDPSGERETKETKQDKTSLAASPRKLVLCTGLGGVGKTQLALRYADTATKAYTHKFWFVADTPDALNASYRLFAKEKGLMGAGYVPDKDVINAVNQWLASKPNWLIIYDNVERYEDIVTYLPTQGAGDVLLTSRLAPIKWPQSITAIAVDVLSMDEANQLIASLIDTPDDVDIPKLATLLGCLPLALVQASAYIRNNAISVADYLKLYEEWAKYLLEQPDMPAGFPAHDPVFVTWDINLDAITKEEKAKGKTVQAKALLQFCAFLSPQKIPSRLIETWHKGAYPNTQEPFEEVQGRLHAYSLIQLHRDVQSIQMHRLVQQVMREQLSAEAQAAQLQQTMELLITAYSQESVAIDKAWDTIRFGLIPHLEVIVYHAQYRRGENTALSFALCMLADAYGDLGQVGKQRDLLERALAIFEAHYGKDHYQVAMTLNNLGTVYGDLGQIGKKRDLLERALAIEEAHYGKDHYQVAMTLANLGAAYYAQGEVSKARDLWERTLAIEEARYGKDHYQVAMTLNNLGSAYGNLGQVGKQRDLLERALAIEEAHYGKDHYQVAMMLANLGAAYYAQGEVSKARDLWERTLAVFEAHYGKDHYQVAATLMNLGIAYGNLGQVGKKRELLERALAIQEAHYGKDHYQVAATLMNLGIAYGELGQVGKKRELLERVLAIREAHYGKDHYQVAVTLHNLGTVYGDLGQVGKKRELLERALAIREAYYGKDHYQVAATLMNLGIAYGNLGQVDKKRELLERALAIQEAHYGKDHYQVAATLMNLGNAYGDLGQVGKQQNFLEHALKIQEKYLGSEHTQTAITRYNLAVAYAQQEKLQASLALAEIALAVFTEYFGSAHTHTKKTLELLSSLYSRLDILKASVEAARKEDRPLSTLTKEVDPPEQKAKLVSPPSITVSNLVTASDKPEKKEVAIYSLRNNIENDEEDDLENAAALSIPLPMSDERSVPSNPSMATALPNSMSPKDEDNDPEPPVVHWHLSPSGSRGVLAPCFKRPAVVSSSATSPPLAELFAKLPTPKAKKSNLEKTSNFFSSTTGLSASKYEEELIERLSILTAQKGHSYLDKEQDEMNKQILEVESKLQKVRRKQSEQKDNQNRTALVAYPRVSPPPPSVVSNIGPVSLSTSTLMAPPSNLSSSLTSSSRAGFFSNTGYRAINMSSLNTAGKSTPFDSPMQINSSEAKNNYRGQAGTLLDEVYDLLDQIYPPRDVAYADVRKVYLLQLAEFQRRKGSLTAADDASLKQLQTALQEQGKTFKDDLM